MENEIFQYTNRIVSLLNIKKSHLFTIKALSFYKTTFKVTCQVTERHFR